MAFQSAPTARRIVNRVLLLSTALAASTAQAQNFEAFYGDASARDRGEDVQAVEHCPGGGSIIVGRRLASITSLETLVTRVDNIGAALWQRSYQIGGAQYSEAHGVVEYRDGSGFVLTGNASLGDTRIYAMRIDCDGNVRWTTVLNNQAPVNRGIGYDIIEVPNSVATITTGDVVIVGDERLPGAGGTTHGRIARIDANGNVIYNNAYIEPARIPGLRFRAVTLARASSGTTNDLVIAGSAGRYTDWTLDRYALMFRARLDGTPVCNAMLGDFATPSHDFAGVTTIMHPAFSGQPVLAGAFTPGPDTAPQQGFLTRFAPGTCDPASQSRWPFPGESAAITDIVERPVPAGSPPRFVVSGTVRSAANPSDGFIVPGNVLNLAPGPVQRFGMQAAGLETLRALDWKTDRVVSTGSTSRDWAGELDPGDSYLVQTQPSLATLCSWMWTLQGFDPQLPNERFEPRMERIVKGEPVDTRFTETSGAGYCCALGAG